MRFWIELYLNQPLQTCICQGCPNRIWLLQYAVSMFSSLQQGQSVSLWSTQTSWTFSWLSVLLSLSSLSVQCLFSAPPLCSLTELFIQAMLGGVSCSQGHPVLQLHPSVCFSSRFQGILSEMGICLRALCVCGEPLWVISCSHQPPPNIKVTEESQREAGL